MELKSIFKTLHDQNAAASEGETTSTAEEAAPNAAASQAAEPTPDSASAVVPDPEVEASQLIPNVRGYRRRFYALEQLGESDTDRALRFRRENNERLKDVIAAAPTQPQAVGGGGGGGFSLAGLFSRNAKTPTAEPGVMQALSWQITDRLRAYREEQTGQAFNRVEETAQAVYRNMDALSSLVASRVAMVSDRGVDDILAGLKNGDDSLGGLYSTFGKDLSEDEACRDALSTLARGVQEYGVTIKKAQSRALRAGYEPDKIHALLDAGSKPVHDELKGVPDPDATDGSDLSDRLFALIRAIIMALANRFRGANSEDDTPQAAPTLG